MARHITSLYLSSQLHETLKAEFEKQRVKTPKLTFNAFLCNLLTANLQLPPKAKNFAEKDPSEWGPEDAQALLEKLGRKP